MEITKRVEDAGAAAIAVMDGHAAVLFRDSRLGDHARRLKKQFPVLEMGMWIRRKSGETFSADRDVMPVMIGRAVEGNPWIFPGDESLTLQQGKSWQDLLWQR